jgi:D-amino-acid oxidase
VSPISPLNRRRLLAGASVLGGLSAVGLGGCADDRVLATATAAPSFAPISPLAPVRASMDRVFDITVCLRPFRAEGPRLDVEPIGDATIVHNYGHGGSGWSLSWGSSTIAVQRAMASSPTEIAVVGCGALGLTSAILAQRAGAKVTLYARDLLPETRSARATGTWTPDSRIALADKAAPNFAALWEQMARTSFKTYRSYLGLPGSPVQWMDRYIVSGGTDAAPRAPGGLDFADYAHLIRDISAAPVELPAGVTPFPGASVRRFSSMQFNLADYGHTLMSDFLAAGGQVRRVEFHDPSEIAALKQKVVINCPGYGARALWKDESITPVRGQIAWLIPQAEVTYGLIYDGVNMVSRTDGICVQLLDGGDMQGYGDDNETADRDEARKGVSRLAALYARALPPGPA